MGKLFIGVDPPWGREGWGAVCFLNQKKEVFKYLIEERVEDLVNFIKRNLNVEDDFIIGVDAPLSLGEHTFRECEKMLRRKYKIPCFPSGKKQIISKYGFSVGEYISKELADYKDKIYEVYPYATWKILFGNVPSYKRKREEILRLKSLIEGKLGIKFGIIEYHIWKLPHLFDAVGAAYTVYLYSIGKAEMIGTKEDGFIIIPKKEE